MSTKIIDHDHGDAKFGHSQNDQELPNIASKVEQALSKVERKRGSRQGSIGRTESHALFGSKGSSKITESKLRNSNNQFNKLADKLLSSNGRGTEDADEVQKAMSEAQGFNLVSKSMKTLPTVNNMNPSSIIDKTSRDKISQYIMQSHQLSKNLGVADET